MQLFCRLTPSGRAVQKLNLGHLDLWVLKPSRSVMSGAFLAGYFQSMRLWSGRKPVQAYLIEGRPAAGIPVYCCGQFQGSLEERELGTAKAPEVGVLVMREGKWDVAFRQASKLAPDGQMMQVA